MKISGIKAFAYKPIIGADWAKTVRNVLDEAKGRVQGKLTIDTWKNEQYRHPELLRYGEQYGGFFIRMFREMNLYKTWPWAGDPVAHKDAWKHIWEIFETKGTNHYATWVWNPCTDQGKSTGNRYFPGNDYADWIGLNAYNWGGVGGRKAKTFRELFGIA